MNILTAEGLSKSYGMKTLFRELSFSMEDRDRVGIIGINGTGKSSLLQAIAGVEPADLGTITVSNGLVIEYLSQNPDYDPSATVMEQIFQGSSPVLHLVRNYEAALKRLTEQPDDPKRQSQLMELQMRMDTEEGWLVEEEAKRVLSKLGITDWSRPMGALSGGQRKRVMLAGALIRPSGLLILDEPTNHLDTDAIDWLEQQLIKTKQALLMITHDRYFLDRVANRTFELDGGSLYAYEGNYSRFLELKAERVEREQSEQRKRQNLLRNELEWIRKGAKARTTKQKARIDRFEKLQSSVTHQSTTEMDMSLAGSRLGKKVIELHDIEYAPDGHRLIHNFSYIIQKHDRIGIIGPNGAGKSTLLNLITGRLKPDRGEIVIGETVQFGYFAQEPEAMDPEQRVIDYIKNIAERIQLVDGSSVSATQMLERFLFPPEQQWAPIVKLSGGERRRLFLLGILMKGPNVLLLDEPTNDLDIQTLTLLEAYLDDFNGAVIMVSHDRFFLDRVAETIFAFEAEGKVQHHVGNYTEYQEVLAKREPQEPMQVEAPKKEETSPSRPRRTLKFSYQEQKDYEQIEGWIEQTEKQLEDVQHQMDIAASDYDRLRDLTAEQEKLEAKLEELLERWTYLEELAVEIDKQKAT